MMRLGKKCLKAGGILVCTLCILCGLFLLSARIPKESVREHILESAYRMEEQGERFCLEEGRDWTCMDNYADVEWLNILYSLDPERPWQTMLESPIYVDFEGDAESLTHALVMRVEQELTANTVYDRYWHGMVMILRPLLVFMNMEQIYRFMVVVFLLMFLCLCVLLHRRKLTYVAVLMALAVLPCGLQYVPFCAEYWSPWLLSLLLMIYVLLRRPGVWEGSLLMMVSGICTAYFDFLTTETVTFGLPFMLLLLLWQQENQKESTIGYLLTMIRAGMLWAAGYGITMVVKWTGASVLLGDNRILFSMGKVNVWQSTEKITHMSRIDGIFQNIRMIWPFHEIQDDLTLLLLLLFIMFLVFVFVFLFRKKKSKGIEECILFLGFLPIARYLVLPYHMQYHYFFTYRALYLTVMAIAVYVFLTVEWKLFKK